MDSKSTLQTVDRAIQFLEQVATADVPPSVKAVTAALDLNITTCYHLMRTLEAHDYVRKLNGGGLVVGEGVKTLLRGFEAAQPLEAQILPHLQNLLRATQETTFFSVLEGKRVVLKRLLEGTRSLRVAGLYEGLTGQEYQRAAGKCILANLRAKERETILTASLASKDEVDQKAVRESLKLELPEIKNRGLAFDRQTEEGIVAIGAPIFEPSGAVVGAIGVVMPEFRLERDESRYLETVRTTAAEISTALNRAPLVAE